MIEAIFDALTEEFKTHFPKLDYRREGFELWKDDFLNSIEGEYPDQNGNPYCVFKVSNLTSYDTTIQVGHAAADGSHWDSTKTFDYAAPDFIPSLISFLSALPEVIPYVARY